MKQLSFKIKQLPIITQMFTFMHVVSISPMYPRYHVKSFTLGQWKKMSNNCNERIYSWVYVCYYLLEIL